MSPARIKQQHGVQSIEVGARLLQVLAESSEPMMLKDLAAAADMPAPQAHRYLVSFTRMGLVEQVAESGHYDLGAFALQLGLSALARIEPVTVASPELQALSRETAQTVALAVWANGGPTIVRWVSSDAPVAASLRVGSVMPLTRSATGGVFLAYLPRSATARLLRREFLDNVRHGLSPTTEADVDASVTRMRQRGYAHTNDFIPGIAGIAAPIFGHDGQIVLALTALGYSKPFEAQLPTIRSAVLRVAGRLSMRLGFRRSA